MNANPFKYHNLSGNICSAGIDPNLIRFKRSLAVTAQVQCSWVHGSSLPWCDLTGALKRFFLTLRIGLL